MAANSKLKGKRLPLLDRVEISIIEADQPRWLAFLNGEHDIVEEVPAAFADKVMPNAKLAPNLEKRGVQMVRYLRSDVALSYFAMEHPVLGGYTPEKVALRRAISLAVDLDKEIRLVRKGQAVPAQGPIGPGSWGYDPTLKSEMAAQSRPRQGSARPLWLRRPRWRRLARFAQWRAAGNRIRDPARPGKARPRRAMGRRTWMRWAFASSSDLHSGPKT